jgi:hypothetical protein
MIRLTTVAALVAASALAGTAYAENQLEIAEKLNEEGKSLMFKTRYVEATAKFRQAIARIPGEPKYYLNLCMSLFHEGKFGDAHNNCKTVERNNPNGDQRAKADKLAKLIEEEAAAQKIDLKTGGGGGGGELPPDCSATPDDPACGPSGQPDDICRTNPEDPSCPGPGPGPGPTGGPPPPVNHAVGRPPSGTGVFMSTTPDNKYTWTLGVELFGGGGSIGQDGFYGTATTGLRVKGDYMLNPATRFGAQGYIQFTHLDQGEMDTQFAETLDIFDFGVAGYKHLCPRGAQRLCLTPLIGVQLSMMSPAGDMNSIGEQVFNYAAVGGRLELGAHYAFGSRMEHVFGVTLGVNMYSAVFSGPEDNIDADPDAPSIAQVGLDKGGAAGYFGLGYTYRFRTPLGRAPFITLE